MIREAGPRVTDGTLRPSPARTTLILSPFPRLPVHDYRVEKQRLTISLRLRVGHTHTGEIFVPRALFGHDTAADVLNAAEPFFPLQVDDTVVLVAKDHVVDVWGADVAGESEARLVGTVREAVEIAMAGGVVHVGALMLAGPAGRHRLLDVLNDHTPRFLTLYTVEGVHLVNVRLIESVRPLD